MGSDPLVCFRLSPAQARAVNAGLALLEVEAEDRVADVSLDVVVRTRSKVHAALDAAGVTP